MTEFYTVLVEHVAIWAPSLVSIVGFIAMLIPVFIKCRDYLKGLKEDKTLVELSEKLEQVACENKELIRCNKLLLDEITKIKDYADTKKKEE